MSMISGSTPRFTNVDAVGFRRLFAPGHQPVFMQGQNIAANIIVLPGTILGRITASGILQPSVKTATDGSQIPYAIAHRLIDTTATGPSGVAAVQSSAVVAHATVTIQGLVIDTSWGNTPDLAYAAIEPYLRAIGIFGVQQFHSYT